MDCDNLYNNMLWKCKSGENPEGLFYHWHEYLYEWAKMTGFLTLPVQFFKVDL